MATDAERAKAARYYARHREKIALYRKSDARRAATARYRAKHGEKCRAATRKWNTSPDGRANRGAWAKANVVYHVDYARRLRQEVLQGYGGVCKCCGESQWQFLAIDHVQGGGAKERRSGMKGSTFLCMLRRMNYPPEYRLLCHNCNMAIGVYGSCPHAAAKESAA